MKLSFALTLSELAILVASRPALQPRQDSAVTTQQATTADTAQITLPTAEWRKQDILLSDGASGEVHVIGGPGFSTLMTITPTTTNTLTGTEAVTSQASYLSQLSAFEASFSAYTQSPSAVDTSALHAQASAVTSDGATLLGALPSAAPDDEDAVEDAASIGAGLAVAGSVIELLDGAAVEGGTELVGEQLGDVVDEVEEEFNEEGEEEEEEEEQQTSTQSEEQTSTETSTQETTTSSQVSTSSEESSAESTGFRTTIVQEQQVLETLVTVSSGALPAISAYTATATITNINSEYTAGATTVSSAISSGNKVAEYGNVVASDSTSMFTTITNSYFPAGTTVITVAAASSCELATAGLETTTFDGLFDYVDFLDATTDLPTFSTSDGVVYAGTSAAWTISSAAPSSTTPPPTSTAPESTAPAATDTAPTPSASCTFWRDQDFGDWTDFEVFGAHWNNTGDEGSTIWDGFRAIDSVHDWVWDTDDGLAPWEFKVTGNLRRWDCEVDMKNVLIDAGAASPFTCIEFDLSGGTGGVFAQF